MHLTQVACFNEALAEMRAAVGDGLKISVEVKPAGTQSCKVRMQAWHYTIIIKPAMHMNPHMQSYSVRFLIVHLITSEYSYN
jgi:hypothetical protein